MCDGCFISPIDGSRYTCLLCPNTDFCAGCGAAHAASSSPPHPLVEFARPLAHGWSHTLPSLHGSPAPDVGFSLVSRMAPTSLLAPSFAEALAVGPPTPLMRDRIRLASELFVAAMHALPDSTELAALQRASDECGGSIAGALRDAWARSPSVRDAPRALDSRFWLGVGAPEVVRAPALERGGERRRRLLQAYRPLCDAAVLVSELDGLPLAALQVRVSSSSSSSSGGGGGGGGGGSAPQAAAAAPRPPFAVLRSLTRSGDLQAMLSADESDVEVVLTNLMTTEPIRFQLVPTAGGGDGTPTGPPLNAGHVVLQPGESVVVDRRSWGSRHALRVREVRETTSAGTLAPVALAEELGRAVADRRGSYLAAHVALSHVTLRTMRTRWAVADVILRDVTPGSYSTDTLFPQSREVGESREVSESHEDEDEVSESRRGFSAQSQSLRRRVVNESVQLQSVQLQSVQSSQSGSSFRFPPRVPALTLASHVAVLVDGAPLPPLPEASKPASQRRGTGHHEASFRAPLSTATLGFSVQPALERPRERCDALLLSRQRALLAKVAGSGLLDEYAASPVSVSDHCVICLEGAPDAVFFPCGHACTHFEEAERLAACPLCRRMVLGLASLAHGRLVRRAERPPSRFNRDAFGAWSQAPGNRVMSQKPVIYLYPPHALDVRVGIAVTGGAALTYLLPDPAQWSGEGGVGAPRASWAVRALPDGTLTARSGGGAAQGGGDGGGGEAPPPVASLFWESTQPACMPRSGEELPRGATVRLPARRAGDWLLRALPRLGLSVREATEMAQYWGPRFFPASAAAEAAAAATAAVGLQPPSDSEVLIHFLPQAALELAAPLSVTPAPDATLRVYMVWCHAAPAEGTTAAALGRLGEYLSPAAWEATHHAAGLATRDDRAGRFTVVEWGGGEVPPGGA